MMVRFTFVLVVAAAAAARAGEAPALRVAPGFRVAEYADETLADDIFAMTLDPSGRVVVSGPGYVRTLLDDDNDGDADRAVTIAEPPTGAMGLCFDGDRLYLTAGGWLERHRLGPDGKAVGEPERLLPLAFAEHGGHAIRKGPDGRLYVIGGNDAGIGPAHAGEGSPIAAPEAGALLRIDPNSGRSEVVAQGFRNPYDFDFNDAGDVFTYDSDVERDAFLPWYSPTRLYHVAHGGHHGWRVTGYLRCWARPGDSPDTVDILAPIGRGSPTGVVCYRHDRFPPEYRGGLFFLDWTFGIVYFAKLHPEGASYRAEMMTFLEPTGTEGFAPTDAVVAPDGALLVSIGGRKTRGAVYRITPAEEEEKEGDSPPPADELVAALTMPRPLDAPSRTRWEPIARRLGPGPFAEAVADEGRPAAERVRAVEILTECLGGLPVAASRAGAKSAAAPVRRRVAWSLGVAPGPEARSTLLDLAADADPAVRRDALDALADHADEWEPPAAESLVSSFAHADRRVRQSAARLASRLPAGAWNDLREHLRDAGPQARLTGVLAALWRDADADPSPGAASEPRPDFNRPAIAETLAVLDATDDPGLALQAARLLVRALGDYHLNNPSVEIFTGYEPPKPVPDDLRRPILRAIRPRFPSGVERLDEELGRLLAMLRDDDPHTLDAVAGLWTEDSDPTRDLHFLIVFARLTAPRTAPLSRRSADALLGLDAKLGGRQARIKQTWAEREAELVAALIAKNAGLRAILIEDPRFVDPAHVGWVAALPGEAARVEAARRFLDRARDDPDFPWTPPLVGLLSRLPAEEVRPLLRAHADDPALRDAIILSLAERPEVADRGRFLAALESADPATVLAALGALEVLPPDRDAARAVPVLRRLRRLVAEPDARDLRARVVALLGRMLGRAIAVDESSRDPARLREAYAPVFDAFANAHPELAAAVEGDDEDPSAVGALLERMDGASGDAGRGRAVFEAKACATCHTGPSRLGPDLAGVAARFDRGDLLAAIALPNRDVAPAYRVTVVETADGRILSGIVIFESADGILLQTGASGTLRLADEQIAARRVGDRSLMPTGLLRDLEPGQVADLLSYLQTLGQGG